MVKKAYRKKIAVTVMAAALMISGSVIAEEAETETLSEAVPAETIEMEVPETEAPAPQTEAPAPATEAPQTEAPAPVTEAPQTEAPAPETEAPQTEAPAPETEAPQTEAAAPETEAPQTEAAAPETEAPAAETLAAVPETEAPAAEVEAPAAEAEELAPQTEAAAPEAETPAAEAEAPAETETSAPETEAPAAETEAPATEAETSAPETEAPAAETEASAAEVVTIPEQEVPKGAAPQAEEETGKKTFKTDFYYENEEVVVTAKARKEAQLPEGTVMNIRKLQEGTAEYNAAKQAAEAKTGVSQTATYRFYDVSFLLNGKELNPADGTVSIQVQFKTIQVDASAKTQKILQISGGGASDVTAAGTQGSRMSSVDFAI